MPLLPASDHKKRAQDCRSVLRLHCLDARLLRRTTWPHLSCGFGWRSRSASRARRCGRDTETDEHGPRDPALDPRKPVAPAHALGPRAPPRPAASFPNSRRIPSTIRYAAPAYFTIENAVADATSSDEMPTAAAVTWTSVPVWMPSTEATPARRPPPIVWPTTYMTAGPGISRSVNAVATNTR